MPKKTKGISPAKIEELKKLLRMHPMTQADVTRFFGYPVNSHGTGSVSCCLLALESAGVLLYEDDHKNLCLLTNEVMDAYEEVMRYEARLKEKEKMKCYQM